MYIATLCERGKSECFRYIATLCCARVERERERERESALTAWEDLGVSRWSNGCSCWSFNYRQWNICIVKAYCPIIL